MIRRTALLALLLTAAGAAAQAVPGHPTRARPNIVLIMADDLEVGSIERLLELGLAPSLERSFVDRGVRFTNAFVTSSLCCPSRATLLTGQYAHNHGVLSNAPPSGGAGALDDRSTIATWLHDAGYRTGYIGKYLNAYGLVEIDGDGRLGPGDRTYVPPGWDTFEALVGTSTYRMFDYALNDDGVLLRYGAEEADYQTDVLARRAAEFIASPPESPGGDAPFFLVVMPVAPHLEVFLRTSRDDYTDPWRWSIRPAPRHQGTVRALPPRPPSFNEADVADKPPWLQLRPRLTLLDYLFLTRQYRDRLESLRAVDDLIGVVVDALERAGVLDDTVLFFSSDNGFLNGEHRLSQKRYAYEEAIRVPLFAFGAGIDGPRAAGGVVLNTDLAPTFADLAGVAPPEWVDGSSFVPLLGAGAPPVWRKRFLVEHDAATQTLFEVPSYRAVRTGEDDRLLPGLLYVAYDSGSRELYDLAADPFELQSLHDDPSWLRRLQSRVLGTWISLLERCAGASCREREFR